MKIGFTGARKGMTMKQRDSVHDLLVDLNPDASVHGDCVGSDADFDKLCESIGVKDRTCRPCTFKNLRAYTSARVVGEPKRPMERNREIVDDADAMIACPPNFERIRKGSGTWATIGFTKRANKPLYIVYPDGSISNKTHSKH